MEKKPVCAGSENKTRLHSVFFELTLSPKLVFLKKGNSQQV